jgi:2-polyprenyl-6-methoxyphenol hydroxylase-like FAD-dependent oxidoreductase
MPHALVIGGSLGGLASAVLLRQSGWRVTIFERSAGDLAGRGAGLGITENLLEVLRRAGAHIDPSTGVVIDRYAWVDATGQTKWKIERPSFASAWPRIYQPLRALVSDDIYRAGMNLERVTQDATSVTAHFSDGTAVTGDLLVAADGNASTVRRQFLPEVEPRYAGYVAWRGIVEERDMSPAAQAMIFGRIVFSFPEGEMMLTMPSPGVGEDTRPGFRRCYFIWYRPAPAATKLRELFTDATGRDHGQAIPPPLIRPHFIEEIRAQAHKIFAPPLGEIVSLAAQPLLQAITDMESPCITFGRVALVGDSAFIARPHVAAGVTKAALDAQCLADTLAAAGNDVARALEQYNLKQHDFGSKLVAHSRYLGAGLENTPGEPPVVRDPIRIILDYGAPHLLRQVDVTRVRPKT